MIREKLLALREHRAVLISRAADQRSGAMTLVRRVERATAWFERAKSVASRLRANPLWVVAAVAVIVAARPRKALKLFATGYSLWQGWRNLRSAFDRMAPAQPRRAYHAN
jgi:hypothetical protein